MTDFTLYIGDKNYSSWSLRGWLAMKMTGAPFEEVLIPLAGGRTPAIDAYSPSGRVPALKHRDLIVWDSLAIAEYLAELFPEKTLWPEERAARAVARAVSAEMHSGFAGMREALSMDLRRVAKPAAASPAAREDVARVLAIWSDCRARFGAGGPFLFGRFTVADCMFAPVACRFRSYAVEVPADARAYMDAIFAWPAMREWEEAAARETRVIAAYDRR